jgi:hypothetical protein
MGVCCANAAGVAEINTLDRRAIVQKFFVMIRSLAGKSQLIHVLPASGVAQAADIFERSRPAPCIFA